MNIMQSADDVTISHTKNNFVTQK